jgi:hypothetical protein
MYALYNSGDGNFLCSHGQAGDTNTLSFTSSSLTQTLPNPNIFSNPATPTQAPHHKTPKDT